MTDRPMHEVEQAVLDRGWLEEDLASAVYASAGSDTRPFTLLHPDFLVRQSRARVRAPNFFVFIDKNGPSQGADAALAFADDRTQIETVEQRWISGSIPGHLLRVRLKSTDLSERDVAVLRLRMENESFARLVWPERWKTAWFIGVCDGCGGFGMNDRCENQLVDPKQSVPLRLGARWWVTDHLPGSDAPTTRVRGAEDLVDGDLVVPADGSDRVLLAQIAFLSTDWRSRVADSVRLYGGARVLEVLGNPVDRRTAQECSQHAEQWARNVEEWRALGIDPPPFHGAANAEVAELLKRVRARRHGLREEGRFTPEIPSLEDTERSRLHWEGVERITPDSSGDALGRCIPDGELRVWLDDDLEDRQAPEGWVHLTTAWEVMSFLRSGRVMELSLDHDLSDDRLFGRGIDVVNFLGEQQEVHDRLLWPRDGITIHSANAYGREAMARAIKADAGRRVEVVESRTPGGKPRFLFEPKT